jgi:hypothetical protein
MLYPECYALETSPSVSLCALNLVEYIRVHEGVTRDRICTFTLEPFLVTHAETQQTARCGSSAYVLSGVCRSPRNSRARLSQIDETAPPTRLDRKESARLTPQTARAVSD